MINDCKNCHSMVYDSAVGWACCLLKPMKLCEDITQEDCPIQRKKFFHQQMEEALAIVNDRKNGVLNEPEQPAAPVKKKKDRPRKAAKKMVEHRMDENDGKLKEFLGRDGYIAYCKGCVLDGMLSDELTVEGLKKVRLRVSSMIEELENE